MYITVLLSEYTHTVYILFFSVFCALSYKYQKEEYRTKEKREFFYIKDEHFYILSFFAYILNIITTLSYDKIFLPYTNSFFNAKQ